jgi:hypothetical protein
VATAIALPAPGVPMGFMGHELLENRALVGQSRVPHKPSLLHRAGVDNSDMRMCG